MNLTFKHCWHHHYSDHANLITFFCHFLSYWIINCLLIFNSHWFFFVIHRLCLYLKTQLWIIEFPFFFIRSLWIERRKKIWFRLQSRFIFSSSQFFFILPFSQCRNYNESYNLRGELWCYIGSLLAIWRRIGISKKSKAVTCIQCSSAGFTEKGIFFLGCHSSLAWVMLKRFIYRSAPSVPSIFFSFCHNWN